VHADVEGLLYDAEFTLLVGQLVQALLNDFLVAVSEELEAGTMDDGLVEDSEVLRFEEVV